LAFLFEINLHFPDELPRAASILASVHCVLEILDKHIRCGIHYIEELVFVVMHSDGTWDLGRSVSPRVTATATHAEQELLHALNNSATTTTLKLQQTTSVIRRQNQTSSRYVLRKKCLQQSGYRESGLRWPSYFLCFLPIPTVGGIGIMLPGSPSVRFLSAENVVR